MGTTTEMNTTAPHRPSSQQQSRARPDAHSRRCDLPRGTDMVDVRPADLRYQTNVLIFNRGIVCLPCAPSPDPALTGLTPEHLFEKRAASREQLLNFLSPSSNRRGGCGVYVRGGACAPGSACREPGQISGLAAGRPTAPIPRARSRHHAPDGR